MCYSAKYKNVEFKQNKMYNPARFKDAHETKRRNGSYENR